MVKRRCLYPGQSAAKFAAESGSCHNLADLVLGPGKDTPLPAASGGGRGFIGGTYGAASTGDALTICCRKAQSAGRQETSACLHTARVLCPTAFSQATQPKDTML